MSLLEARSNGRTRNSRSGHGRDRTGIQGQQTQQTCPNDVNLPDGSTITHKRLHELRSSAHQRLSPRDFETCAARIRAALSSRQWDPIQQWINANIAGNGSRERRENTLITVLLCVAAERNETNASIIFDQVTGKRTAKGTLLAA